MNSFTNALGLDVGDARIGVARINSIAQIAEPLIVLKNDDDFSNHLQELIQEYSADILVVGLPRNMSGEKTKQTKVVEDFVAERLADINIKTIFQDETLSTVAAEARMPKNVQHLQDAYAACVILEDFLQTEG
jgi:putative Holliday junction resolvase